MPLRDVLIAALSRPAGKVVDAPVRELIHQILAERGFPSPAEVAALREETSALRDQISSLQERLEQLEHRPASVAPTTTQRRSLIPEVPEASPEDAAARQRWVRTAVQEGKCKVLDCQNAPGRDGFCAEHYAMWKAGRLPGFVSPKGLVSVGGQPRRIAPNFAGQSYASHDGQVIIDERIIPSVQY